MQRIRSELAIINETFCTQDRAMRQKGLGLRIFRRQLYHAKALQIRRIETDAGRRDNENGYSRSWVVFRHYLVQRLGPTAPTEP